LLLDGHVVYIELINDLWDIVPNTNSDTSNTTAEGRKLNCFSAKTTMLPDVYVKLNPGFPNKNSIIQQEDSFPQQI
jgi:hypothetical protein